MIRMPTKPGSSSILCYEHSDSMKCREKSFFSLKLAAFGSEHIDTALLIQSRDFWYNARMRRNRFIGQDRCYHLISRLAHRAFFLDDEEKDRAVTLREAVGIRSRVHFSRCYMTPLVEKGLVARTNPDKPMSPRQEYKLA